MVPQFLHRPTDVSNRRAMREYGSLFVLLLTSLLLQVTVTRRAQAGAEWLMDVFEPRLVGAAVYMLLGLAVIASVSLAVRRLRDEDGLECHELCTFAGAMGLFLFAAAYQLLGVTDIPLYPRDVVSPLLNGVGAMALVAVAYAGVRGFEVRFDLPDRDALPLAGLTALLSALAGVGWIVAVTTFGNSAFVSFRATFGPHLSIRFLLVNVVLPGLFVGFGMATLYNGVIQAVLDQFEGPSAAVAATTVLVGVVTWSLAAFGRTSTAVATATTVTGVVLLSVLAALVAARAIRVVSQALYVAVTPVLAASIGIVIVVVALLAAVAVDQTTAGFVPYGAGLTFVAAVGSVGYDRSRSVWLPTLAFATYLIVVDAELALNVAKFIV